MAGSVNQAIIVGNLGEDPEVRSMQSGDRVCNLSIATSESWKDKTTGERKEKAEWHRVSIFNKGIVDVAERHLKKGAKVYIEGQIETRKYQDQQGQDRYTTEIVLRPFRGELTILSSAGEDRGDSQQPDRGSPSYGTGGAPGYGGTYAPPEGTLPEYAPTLPAQPSGGANYAADLNDEIPF